MTVATIVLIIALRLLKLSITATYHRHPVVASLSLLLTIAFMAALGIYAATLSILDALRWAYEDPVKVR